MDKKKLIFPSNIKKIIHLFLRGTIIFAIISVAIFVSISFFHTFLKDKFLLIAICYFLFTVFYIIIISVFRRKDIEKLVMDNREQLVIFSYTTSLEMDIIFSMFTTLEKIRRVEDNTALNLVFNKVKNSIVEMRESFITLEQYDNMLENLESIDEVEMEQKLYEINSNILYLRDSIIEVACEVTDKFFNTKSEVSTTNYSMATLTYFISNIIPIISDMSITTNQFSKGIITSVITHFEEIANFSTQITNDIQKIMADLLDEKNKESLAYVTRQIHEVVEEFQKFFDDMANLESVTTNFVEVSINRLQNIGVIVDSIEEISETMKMISLNVSIEAANTGAAGKGFNVLARDLRDFAHKTMQFAHDVKRQIKDTIQTTQKLKKDYEENMTGVLQYIKSFKTSIETFEIIIVNSFEKIKGIIETLQVFSTKIDGGIKEIVGKLQYYDITSQEVEHLSRFIFNVFRISRKKVNEVPINEILNEDARSEIRADILKTIKGIITTNNERKIYEKYKTLFKVEVKEDIAKTGDKNIDDLDTNISDIILF